MAMTATSQVMASGPEAARIHATAPSGRPTYTGASANTADAANTGGPGGVEASTINAPAIVAPMRSAPVASAPIAIESAGGPPMATHAAAAAAATNSRGTSAPSGRASPASSVPEAAAVTVASSSVAHGGNHQMVPPTRITRTMALKMRVVDTARDQPLAPTGCDVMAP